MPYILRMDLPLPPSLLPLHLFQPGNPYHNLTRASPKTANIKVFNIRAAIQCSGPENLEIYVLESAICRVLGKL